MTIPFALVNQAAMWVSEESQSMAMPVSGCTKVRLTNSGSAINYQLSTSRSTTLVPGAGSQLGAGATMTLFLNGATVLTAIGGGPLGSPLTVNLGN